MFRPSLAISGLVILGMLFLPERVAIDLPGLPSIGKGECVVLLALLGALASGPRRLFIPFRELRVEVIFVLVSICCFLTALTNGDVLHYGPITKPSMGLKDGLSMSVSYLLNYGLPFYLAHALIRRPRDLSDLIKLVAAAGVLYSLFALVEMRMSPQWHKWIYGYHQFPIRHSYRFGGYRPAVFMPNGLSVSILIAAAGIAARSLGKAKLRMFFVPVKSGMVSNYLLVILILCRSVGAGLLGLTFHAAVAGLRRRTLARVLTVLAVIVMIYPLTRVTGVFPSRSVVSLATLISEERADSLEFRFRHEDRIVEKARQRFLFGWGRHARGRVYDERGRNISITDSQWILWLSGRGVFTMCLLFAALYLPVLLAIRRLPQIRSVSSQILLLGTAAIILLYSIDMLVNAAFVKFPYFLAGALMGTLSDSPLRPTGARQFLDRQRTHSAIP
jgi:hypothetical protein